VALSPSDPAQTGRDRSDGTAGENATNRGQQTSENRTDAGADYDFLSLVRICEERDAIFKSALQKNNWRRSYDAFHNRHASDSKYTDTAWRKKRTSLFRPKTRTSVRKAMAAAAASLFTTSDVVQVSAEPQKDPKRAASAAVLKEILAYRLDRTSAEAGMPWFMICMGAHLDSQITGVCYTKQYWEYEKVTERASVLTEMQHFYQDSGEPVLDPMSGEPVTSTQQKETEQEFVTKDRPWSLNIPPDNVMIDAAAPWINAEQRSGYLILRVPMTLEDARTMLSNPGKSGEQWLDVPDSLLTMVTDDYTSKGVRIARAADRTDPQENRAAGAAGNQGNTIVWLYECFLRVKGVDYHFWSLGSMFYASRVRTTRQAYPEQHGERPVVRGYALLETHETFPMSPVLSWQEMQKELNDLVNLRLDTAKQALSPIAKVKQGTTFDFQALQNRAGADTTIIVRNMDDLEFDRTPDTSAGSYEETNYLNADFDDLAGVFNSGSVSTNRHLNETVGGMQLLNGSANSVQEFDLRVFIETFAERALRQIVRLEQYYESDEVVFAIAADRAGIFERYGVDQITDQDLERDVTVRVNVGLGSADPMQRLTKLRMALATLAPMIPMMDKKIVINAEEILKEVMGAAGYNDGMRFVTLTDMPQMGGPGMEDPNQIAAMEAQVKTQLANLQTQSQERIAAGDRQSKSEIEQMRQTGALLQVILGQIGEMKRHQAKLDQTQKQHSQSMFANVLTQGARNTSAAHIADMRGKQAAAKPAAGAR
jgi:hypothetical protein